MYLVESFTWVGSLSWDASNKGNHLKDYVEECQSQFGFYLEKVLAYKLYCSRENRKWLKEKNIKMAARPLGRPSAKAVENHVKPGERNPIEGKFGQAKLTHGTNHIKATLSNTGQS